LDKVQMRELLQQIKIGMEILEAPMAMMKANPKEFREHLRIAPSDCYEVIELKNELFDFYHSLELQCSYLR